MYLLLSIDELAVVVILGEETLELSDGVHEHLVAGVNVVPGAARLPLGRDLETTCVLGHLVRVGPALLKQGQVAGLASLVMKHFMHVIQEING